MIMINPIIKAKGHGGEETTITLDHHISLNR